MGLPYLIAVVFDLASKRHTQPPVFGPEGGGNGGGGVGSLGPGLLFFGGVLLVALIAYLAYAAQRARRQQFQRMATQLNLVYSQHDPNRLLLRLRDRSYRRGQPAAADRAREPADVARWHAVLPRSTVRVRGVQQG